MDATEQALLALDRAGADIIELGVPYSVRAYCLLLLMDSECSCEGPEVPLRTRQRRCFNLPLTMQDPLADGPTIQAAATRALAAGCTLNKVRPLVLPGPAEKHISILFKEDD